MRGENYALKTDIKAAEGSSPHARGKHHRGGVHNSQVWLIPACAGKTFFGPEYVFHHLAHPRMRGENVAEDGTDAAVEGSSPHARGKPVTDMLMKLGAGSSPHARGKPITNPSQVIVERLIPACAGKTSVRVPGSLLAKAHPRMRGENPP